MKQSLGADPESIRIPESVKIMRAKVSPLLEGEGSLLDHGFCDSALRLRAE